MTWQKGHGTFGMNSLLLLINVLALFFFFALNVLGPCILLMRRCNSTPASSTEKNRPLQIKEVTLSRLAGGRTMISGKRGGGVSPGWEAEAPTV